jgi:hypothetical protein
MKFTRLSGAVAAGLLAAGMALVPATSASASGSAQYTIGPFGSLTTCDYNRYQYKQAYSHVGPCWQNRSDKKWYFFVTIYG